MNFIATIIGWILGNIIYGCIFGTTIGGIIFSFFVVMIIGYTLTCLPIFKT